MSFLVNPYWYVAPCNDADANAFLTAAGITDATITSAICTLVTTMKADGTWAKCNAIYPMVGGTATTHKYNLKNPLDTNAAFRLSFVGGWTHSANGAMPNGTNGYANTFLTPSITQSVNNNGLGMYITERTVSGVDPVQIGVLITILQASLIAITPTVMASRLNSANINTTIIGGGGSFDSHRTAAATTKNYKNGSLIRNLNSGGTLANLPIYLGTVNNNGTANIPSFVNSEFRFAYISSGLSDTEVSNLRTSQQTFNTTLGRQL
jgi:hypothetical protein